MKINIKILKTPDLFHWYDLRDAYSVALKYEFERDEESDKAIYYAFKKSLTLQGIKKIICEGRPMWGRDGAAGLLDHYRKHGAKCTEFDFKVNGKSYINIDLSDPKSVEEYKKGEDRNALFDEILEQIPF